jgi:hypothetical protein
MQKQHIYHQLMPESRGSVNNVRKSKYNLPSYVTHIARLMKEGDPTLPRVQTDFRRPPESEMRWLNRQDKSCSIITEPEAWRHVHQLPNGPQLT